MAKGVHVGSALQQQQRNVSNYNSESRLDPGLSCWCASTRPTSGAKSSTNQRRTGPKNATMSNIVFAWLRMNILVTSCIKGCNLQDFFDLSKQKAKAGLFWVAFHVGFCMLVNKQTNIQGKGKEMKQLKEKRRGKMAQISQSWSWSGEQWS